MEYSKPIQLKDLLQPYSFDSETSETENEKPAPLYEFKMINQFQNYKDFQIFNEFELNSNIFLKEFKEKTSFFLNEFENSLLSNSQEFLNNKNYSSKLEVELNHRQIFKAENIIIFQTRNYIFEKTGNIIKKNSKRYENYRQKIIRNFIQYVAIYWICDEEKNMKLKKIQKKFLLYKYTEYKGKKLKEIYGENQQNKNIVQNAKGSMLIKLNFKFEEAFKAFCFKKERKNILAEVVKRELEDKEISTEEKEEFKKLSEDAENFFIKLKSKQEYINEKIIEKDDLNYFENSFKELINEFNINYD